MSSDTSENNVRCQPKSELAGRPSKIMTIELTIEHEYSNNSNCVCCIGPHRYTTHFITNNGGYFDAGELAQTYCEKLPDKAKIKITVEQI